MPTEREDEAELLRIMAKNISDLISKRKTSAHRVSIAAGLNKNYVSRLITGAEGNHSPSIAKAIRIARVLGVTLDELIEEDPVARAPDEVGDLSELLLGMDEAQRLRVVEALRVLVSSSKN